MEFDKDIEIQTHKHEAQWGIVLEGEIELIIHGKKEKYRKGDRYFIPKGVEHSAKIYAGYSDITFFNKKDRYKTK
ncbi:MAG: cupin domain-containing protein [Bacteroidales bacterium]|nr:cupin domain-containing protein [Bacteroidales bacterium]